MKLAKLMVGLACVASAAGGGAAYVMSSAQAAQVAPYAQEAPQATVTPIMSKDLPGIPGKEGLMITVEYPPGSVDPIHRHCADAFVYVLEGTIVMQVRGGPEMTLSPGQTFYEGPDDVHIVGRKESQTKPAKFVVFLVKNIGAPVLVPAT